MQERLLLAGGGAGCGLGLCHFAYSKRHARATLSARPAGEQAVVTDVVSPCAARGQGCVRAISWLVAMASRWVERERPARPVARRLAQKTHSVRLSGPSDLPKVRRQA
jgi:hypothetical protein